MTTEDFIIELFCRVDDQMGTVPKHSQASLYPSEVVTLAFLFALKGVGNCAFYRWLVRDYCHLFPHLPDRTRLFRLFNSHSQWTDGFLADHSLIGLADSYGLELIHPRQEGRTEEQIGRKGLSDHRWIVGGKLCFVLNNLGLIVDWDMDTANVYDGTAFQDLINRHAAYMAIFADTGFTKRDWQPDNLRLCRHGEWNTRMIVETVLSMLTLVSHFKKVSIASGRISRADLLTRWPCSIYWFNGMAFRLMKMGVSIFYRRVSLPDTFKDEWVKLDQRLSLGYSL